MTLVVLLFAALSIALLWLLLREHAATVKRLENDNAEGREREKRLIEALTPALRRFNMPVEASRTVEDLLKSRHSIQRGERDAHCSCGWRAHSDDPAVLQAEIAAHHRETSPAVKGGRTSWVKGRNAIENHAAEEAAEELRRGQTA